MTVSDLWDAIPSIATALIAGTVAILVAFKNRSGMRENALIDQLQEQLDRLEESLSASFKRERIRDDYIHELRDHIDQRKSPPPPSWPDGLTR